MIPSNSIRVFDSRPEATYRMYCFSYAGGNTQIYRNWQNKLPWFVEVCGIQRPGIGDRIHERPFTSIPDMAKEAAEIIIKEDKMPFYFFGHSMGALIAFETAKYLLKNYQVKPEVLLLSGRGSPTMVTGSKTSVEAIMEKNKKTFFEKNPEAAHSNKEKEKMFEHLLPAVEADLSAVDCYLPDQSEVIESEVFAMGGMRDPNAGRKEMEAWRSLTTGKFSLQMFPGEHFFIHTHEKLVLNEISEIIEQKI